MYSQGLEESIIVQALTGVDGVVQPGKFLDVGAWDGKTFSNTLRLVELGWEGVLIEPSPTAFCSLLKLHGGQDKLKLINAAVSTNRGLLKFYNSADAVSTAIESNREKWKNDATFTEMYVGQITPDDVLNQFGGFSFVNIDTEGNSTDLLFRFNISNMLPKVVCVEHDGRFDEIRDYLSPFGYVEKYFDGNNIIMVLA